MKNGLFLCIKSDKKHCWIASDLPSLFGERFFTDRTADRSMSREEIEGDIWGVCEGRNSPLYGNDVLQYA